MCKHQNGYLNEYMTAVHSRRVVDGVVEKTGLNEIGNITHYEYRCNECDKVWRLNTLDPNLTRMPPWLSAIVSTFG